MLDKFFKRPKAPAPQESVMTHIRFGRYSDNNKPVEQVAKWNEADALFKEGKRMESIQAFFAYLADEEEQNVVHHQTADGGTFILYQGSKIIQGSYNAKKLQAYTALARMPQPSVPVMRRLLEQNFKLYYSRFALQGEQLCMMFSTDIEVANPSKLYYGLKELATRADKQDDLLVHDFTSLLPEDTGHITEIDEAEKEVKYKWLHKWIRETLELIESVDSDKYSGGVAYLLLALAYRIDFLIVPEGKLLYDLEKIVEIYFRKDDRPVPEKNAEMMYCFQQLLAKSKEQVYPYLFRSRYTFSIVSPQPHKTVADAIYNANQNINWYKEAKQFKIAAVIAEYGFAFCQYSYSLPRPLTEFFLLFMMVNHAPFFRELGIQKSYVASEDKSYNIDAINAEVARICEVWKYKYPDLHFRTERLRWDNAVAFNQSFTNEIEVLNLDTTR